MPDNQKGEQKPTLSWSTPANTKPAVPSAQPVKAVTPTPLQKAPTPVAKPRTGKIIAWIIAIVVVIALATWGLVALHSKNAAQTSQGAVGSTSNALIPGSSENTAPTGGAASAVASLVIPSPQASGREVTVSHIDVSVPTWVVVYENNSGQPGNALGAAWFAPSVHSGTVTLLRGTIAGQTYLVGESRDNGDKEFSLRDDPVVLDAQGNTLWVQFQAR